MFEKINTAVSNFVINHRILTGVLLFSVLVLVVGLLQYGV